MEDFMRTYGLWILLGVVFFALHRFGAGCGGGHRHRAHQDDASTPPGAEGKPTAARRGGCH